jgi:succinate dehydrogenase / fumarate reductase cytochrome b subunit
MKDFLCSTVGKKYIMGVTGLVWLGFVFAHMSGNLLMFVSPDAYNAYGHAITSGKIVYVAEVVLILALLAHIKTAISLTHQNFKARPQRYAMPTNGTKHTALASRTMAATGALVLAFVILHLASFKFGPHYETEVDGVKMRDLHRLLVEVFTQPGYVVWYVVSMFLLGFHLKHGFNSIFQSLGLLNRANEARIKTLAMVYSVVVAGGFLAQPIYVCVHALLNAK